MNKTKNTTKASNSSRLKNESTNFKIELNQENINQLHELKNAILKSDKEKEKLQIKFSKILRGEYHFFNENKAYFSKVDKDRITAFWANDKKGTLGYYDLKLNAPFKIAQAKKYNSIAKKIEEVYKNSELNFVKDYENWRSEQSETPARGVESLWKFCNADKPKNEKKKDTKTIFLSVETIEDKTNIKVANAKSFDDISEEIKKEAILKLSAELGLKINFRKPKAETKQALEALQLSEK
jgi:hypothetical protein